jgi:hypothetical protein
MRVLTGAIAALALVATTGAHAQEVYLAEPAPVYVNPAPYYAAPPVVVAPAPSATYVGPVYDYAYIPQPYTGSTAIVNYRTGRRCTIESSGYRWCWTP